MTYLRRPMMWEPFIEPNLGTVLPSRPYVVRNSYSAPISRCIPAVKHRDLPTAIQDLLDCRQRMAQELIKRQRQERDALHNRHKLERGE